MKRKSIRQKLFTISLCAMTLLTAVHAVADVITPGSYSGSFSVKFDGYTGSSTLTNFPALILLNEGEYGFSYSDMESDDYSDLRFTDSTGTNALPYEVEQWNSAPLVSTNPALVAGCQLWLKADADVETNATGSVTNWLDQSGNGHHATSANLAQSPQYVASALNGQPAVSFDGSDDRLTATGSFSEKTYILVLNNRDNPNFNNWEWPFGSLSPRYTSIYGVPGTSNLGGDGTRYVNGAKTSSFAPLPEYKVVVTADSSARTSAAWVIGRGDAVWSGGIAEVIVYDRSLTTDELVSIYVYLQDKYAIDLSAGTELRTKSAIWVQVPELSADTKINVLWGNTFETVIPPYTTNGAVWTEEYVGVYHLNEEGSTLSFADSSPEANDLTSVTSPAEADGRISGGRSFINNNSDQPPRISSPTGGLSLDKSTVMLWANVQNGYTWRNWCGIEAGSGNHLRLELNNATPGRCNLYQSGIPGANAIANQATPVEDGNWHLLAFTVDTANNEAKTYIDGVQDGSTAAWSAVAAATGLKVGGSWGGYTGSVGGSIDEARFIKGVRSADWIKACNDNQASPSTFATLDLQFYYDTSSSGGLQAGDGTWSTSDTFWNSAADGSGLLSLWKDGAGAWFVADGTSIVTVDTVAAQKITVNGSGYSFNGGTIDLGKGGLETVENLTVGSSIKLVSDQEWNVAEGVTATVTGTFSTPAYMTKTGLGDLYLNNRDANKFLIDGMSINEGRVRFNTGGWYQNPFGGTKTITINAGGTARTEGSHAWGVENHFVHVNGGTLDMGSEMYIRSGSQMTGGQIMGTSEVRFYGNKDLIINPSPDSAIISCALNSVGSPNNLVVADGSAETDLLISGRIHNNGIRKRGDGTAAFTSSANSYSGTWVEGGTLLVNNGAGSGTGSGAVTIDGGTLGGTGIVANVISFGVNGGAIAPGCPTGTLTANSNVVFTATGSLTNSLDVTVEDRDTYSRLHVTDNGTVTLDNATLNVTVGSTLTGGKLFIVVNDGTDAISGTFDGLPEGARITAGPTDFKIYYSADADTGAKTGGNDVAIVPIQQGSLLLLQ